MEYILDIEKETIFHELGHFVSLITLYGKYQEQPVYNYQTNELLKTAMFHTVDSIEFFFKVGCSELATTRSCCFDSDVINKACVIYSGEVAAKLTGYKKIIRPSFTDKEKLDKIPRKERERGKKLAIEIITNNLSLLHFLYSKVEKEFVRGYFRIYSYQLYKWLDEFELSNK